MKYENLLIFKATMDLCVYIETMVKGFEKYHKYTIGADLRTTSKELLFLINRANLFVMKSKKLKRKNKMKKSILTILVLVEMLHATCTRNADETVNCTESRLMWQDDSEVVTIKKYWQDAIKYCEDLTLAGHDDWRLPNLNELKSLVDYEKSSGIKIKNGFANVSSLNYWSSTTSVPDTSGARTVDFDNGFDYWIGKSNSYSVRCVRAGQ